MLRLTASRSLRNGLSRTVTLQARRSLVTKFSKVRSTFHIVAAAALFFAGNIQASLSFCAYLFLCSQDHEWITMEGDIGTIGITNHAQEQLGDVVFVDLPEVGSTVEKDETMGAVESVKAASDIYSPVSGEVVEVNGALNDEPALVNTAAEADGWMAKVKLSAPAELDDLMDAAAYEAFCKE